MRVAELAGGASRDSHLRIVELGVRLLPPDPQHLLDPVRLPAPGPFTFEGSATDFEVGILGDIYRWCMQWRTGRTSQAFTACLARNWRHYPQMIRAVEMMRDAKLPPAAWCMHSFDAASHVAGKPIVPRATWVWSAKRLAKLEWYDQNAKAYLVERHVVVPRHQGLIRAWREMWRSLLQANPQTREGVRVVVDQYFPGVTFERLLTAAKAERAEIERAAQHRVYGAFLPYG